MELSSSTSTFSHSHGLGPINPCVPKDSGYRRNRCRPSSSNRYSLALSLGNPG